MREYAAVNGMFVEFRELPGADRLAGRRGQSAQIIYYGKRLRPRRGEPPKRASFAPDSEGWRSLGRRCEVPLELTELPEEILAAGVDGGSCGVYWQERGGEEQVERIRGVLERWSEALSA